MTKTKAFHAFQQKMIYFSDDLDLVDFLSKVVQAGKLSSETDTTVFTNLNVEKYSYLARRKNSSGSRKLLMTHLKQSIYSAYIKDVYEEVSEYLRTILKNYFSCNIDCARLIGEHNIQNALAVIEAGLYAKLEPEIISKGLKEFKPIEKRWDIQDIKGFKIINDSYNSNPESVKAAIKTFLEFTPNPKVIILGDMGELGKDEKEYHIKIGEFLDSFECDYVLTLGELAKNINPQKIKTVHFDTINEIAEFIKNKLTPGSNILLKASRFMKFEEIIEELKK